jgi:hypothetical protein
MKKLLLSKNKYKQLSKKSRTLKKLDNLSLLGLFPLLFRIKTMIELKLRFNSNYIELVYKIKS